MTTRDRLAEALPLPPGRSTDWVLDALTPVVDAIAAERAAEELAWAATEAECGHDLRMLNRRARAAGLTDKDGQR